MVFALAQQVAQQGQRKLLNYYKSTTPLPANVAIM
jgi:hypothetical protein